jgi:hypothetical protein
MYPHERSLVKEMAGKPFALIGINSDDDRDYAKSRIAAEKNSWRSFWNGPKGTRGPISARWNVSSWPTLYILDQEGVIQEKLVGFGPENRAKFDAAIARLVPLAEKALEGKKSGD